MVDMGFPVTLFPSTPAQHGDDQNADVERLLGLCRIPRDYVIRLEARHAQEFYSYTRLRAQAPKLLCSHVSLRI